MLSSNNVSTMTMTCSNVFKWEVCDCANAMYLCSCRLFLFLVPVKALVDLEYHEKSCNGRSAVISQIHAHLPNISLDPFKIMLKLLF